MDSLPIELQICPTLDGSPTILFSQGETKEKMHSSKGALSESLYIYGQAATQVLEWGWPLRVLSVGLGLGYNEMIALHLAYKCQLNPQNVSIASFEAHPFLRESFIRWLEGQKTPLASTYEEILSLICKGDSVEASVFKAYLAEAFDKGQLKLWGAFPLPNHQEFFGTGFKGFNCVFYDAYCAKTSPELWEERALVAALKPILSEQCLLTTYAAKGSLNRALKELNFSISNREGFSGKRESTWAFRK